MMINYRSIFKCRCFYRSFSSALYVTGDKAQNTFAVVKPVIDFDEQIKCKENLLKNIQARKLNIDVEEIIKCWTFFKDVVNRKQTLEITRAEISQNVTKLLQDENRNQTEIEKLKMHAKMIKEDLKKIKEASYSIEEDTILKILKLPNLLHSNTPINHEHVLYAHSNLPKHNSLHHLIIGEESNYIKFIDPLACFLKSDVGLFEIKLLNIFKEALLKLDYVLFSNPNFCTSVIYEGCNEIAENKSKVFTIAEQHHEEGNLNKLHFCGSATLFSFMAYFTRHLLPHSNFPMKYFSVGKLYHPVENEEKSLFNLGQQTVINIFCVNNEDSEEDIDCFTQHISKLYDLLNVHYRIVTLPAHELDKAESLRISVQMYSNFKQQYIEVGNISFYGNYVSKRLLFTYMDKKEKKYPKIISGVIFNFHKFLGCILENFDKKMLPSYFDEINGFY